MHVTCTCIRWKRKSRRRMRRRKSRCVKNVERNWKRPKAWHKDRRAGRGEWIREKMRRVLLGAREHQRRKEGGYEERRVENICRIWWNSCAQANPPANVGKAGLRLKSNPAACGLIKGFAEFRLFLLLQSSWPREPRFYIQQYRRRLNWKTRLPFSSVFPLTSGGLMRYNIQVQARALRILFQYNYLLNSGVAVFIRSLHYLSAADDQIFSSRRWLFVFLFHCIAINYLLHIRATKKLSHFQQWKHYTHFIEII